LSPEAARQRAALRLAFGATLALVWGTIAREPLPCVSLVSVDAEARELCLSR
jgi:hypothetical protein